VRAAQAASRMACRHGRGVACEREEGRIAITNLINCKPQFRRWESN
jgi:hypothetical protein